MTEKSSSFLPNTVAWTLSSTESSVGRFHSVDHTWDLVDVPSGRRAIGCCWVFNIKDSASPQIYKARLVDQGCRQVQGLDYQETFRRYK
ncbi:binding protein [[Candida] boidinii]|nr:binding protein [[Candida] boidinii]OWB86625.1 binding protein [[Candida] boidinii]